MHKLRVCLKDVTELFMQINSRCIIHDESQNIRIIIIYIYTMVKMSNIKVSIYGGISNCENVSGWFSLGRFDQFGYGYYAPESRPQ